MNEMCTIHVEFIFLCINKIKANIHELKSTLVKLVTLFIASDLSCNALINVIYDINEAVTFVINEYRV